MKRVILAALVLLAIPAGAQAAASWSAGDVSPFKHETIRVKYDWYVATACTRRTYDWIGGMQATVDGRYANILFGNTVVFFADHDEVIGEVAWAPGSRACMTVYNLLAAPRPIRAALHVQDARVHWPAGTR